MWQYNCSGMRSWTGIGLQSRVDSLFSLSDAVFRKRDIAGVDQVPPGDSVSGVSGATGYGCRLIPGYKGRIT